MTKKINNLNSSTPTKNEEENPEKDNLIKQNLISPKTSSKQKAETFTNLSDSNITTKQNNEINQTFNFPQPESNSSLNENNKFTYFQSKKIKKKIRLIIIKILIIIKKVEILKN